MDNIKAGAGKARIFMPEGLFPLEGYIKEETPIHARALLLDNGPVSYTHLTNAATLIQGFLAAVGINVEINSVDPATINTYLADDSQWDLALTQTAAEIYVTQSWLKHLDYNATGTGKTLSFLKDDTLEELVLNAAYISTSTQETIDACHDYVTENAIILGLANPHLSYVVNKDCQSLCFGYKHEILPGACVYTK